MRKSVNEPGVGWDGERCLQCVSCQLGDYMNCQFEKITGIHLDEGYQDYMTLPRRAVVAIPEDLPADEANVPTVAIGRSKDY